MRTLGFILFLLLTGPLLATTSVSTRPHGRHTGTDAERVETAPYIGMSVNAQTPTQDKESVEWTVSAGTVNVYFEYLSGLTEVTIDVCQDLGGGECDSVTTYATTPTLVKDGSCPLDINMDWCWTTSFSVGDAETWLVTAHYTKTLMGYGATSGGRSGTIAHVTNTNGDTSAGSLRAVLKTACQAEAPYYIVFDVAGTITPPNGGARMCGNHITLDGWTAPGAIKLSQGSLHVNCLDMDDNTTQRGMNNFEIWNIFSDMNGNSSADPAGAIEINKGFSATTCTVVTGDSTLVADIFIGNSDMTRSTDDNFSVGREWTDLTFYQNHVYDPVGFLQEFLIQGKVHRVTIFRNAMTKGSFRVPEITWHNEFSPSAGNSPDVTVDIINNVFAMGEKGASVGGGFSRGATGNYEDNFNFGGAVMLNSDPGIDNPGYLVCFDIDSTTFNDGLTSTWVNNNTGAGFCEDSPPACGDVCTGSGSVYINDGNFVWSSYARAPRVKPSDWRTVNSRLSTGYTLTERWDTDTDNLQNMAYDVIDHAGSWPRQSTAATYLADAESEISGAEVGLRGSAKESITSFETSGHLSEVSSPVFAGTVAFASSSGTDAVLYSGGADDEAYLEFRYRKSGTPAGTLDVADMQSAGSSSLCKLEIHSDDTLWVTDGTSSSQVAPDQIDTLSDNTWYWIFMHYQVASTAGCSTGTGIDGTCGYCEAGISQFWGYPISGTTGLIQDASMRYVRPTSQTQVNKEIFPDESDAITMYYDSINSCPSWWCSEGGAGPLEAELPPGGGTTGALVISGKTSTSGKVTITSQ